MRKTFSLALAAALFAAAPALAAKRDNSVRFAYDQVPENVDPYFNNVRIGVIISQQVWDTLIYRDRTRASTRASSRRIGSRSTTGRSSSSCARA
jgi:ABC-type transport system substrate-binding protein